MGVFAPNSPIQHKSFRVIKSTIFSIPIHRRHHHHHHHRYNITGWCVRPLRGFPSHKSFIGVRDKATV